jgi:hypothetical protein
MGATGAAGAAGPAGPAGPSAVAASFSFNAAPTDVLPTAPGSFYSIDCLAPSGGTYTAGPGEIAVMSMSASFRPPTGSTGLSLHLLPALSANGVLSAAHSDDSFDSLSSGNGPLGSKLGGGQVSNTAIVPLTSGIQYKFGMFLWTPEPLLGPLQNNGAACHGSIVILRQ